MTKAGEFTFLGRNADLILAIISNIIFWFVGRFFPALLPRMLPIIDQEDKTPNPSPNQTQCIAIGRPGGKEQLRLITLKPGFVTCGYNIDNPTPFVDISKRIPPYCVVLRIQSFSINYADCCIRWGLYESANRFVGWPIVPGFDLAGVVERVSPESDGSFQIGDHVYGATFFGAYSTRVLVPMKQLRKIPRGLTLAQAAALPAVSLTALYSIYLGGFFPVHDCTPKNRSILIHSAAGGVGSMMVQMSKLLNMSPVVGVVGHPIKVHTATSLGCDVVIDKSKKELWACAQAAAPGGYAVVADANGVSTMDDSFRHLAPAGRLIVFGFHSNLPLGNDMLDPIEWMRMAWRMYKMPKFDPMFMVSNNKSVLGFNLSFFVQELEMLGILYDQIGNWIELGKLEMPPITEMNMSEIAAAHDLIQSGISVGKIVIHTGMSLKVD